jgi:hypothetical protein
MDRESVDTEWKLRLPFLDWGDGRGVRISRDRHTGNEGYRCKDGSVIPYDDPRVAEYHRQFWCAVGAECRAIADEVHDSIIDVDNPEPFSRDYIRERPQFIRWLNEGAPLNDDGTPAGPLTISEFRLAYPAYEERIRRLKESALAKAAGFASNDVDRPTPGPPPRLSVDLARKTITFDGQKFDVLSEGALRWVKVLADHPGEWISGPDLKKYDSALDGARPDRLKKAKSFPDSIRAIIETRRGPGSRLNLSVA